MKNYRLGLFILGLALMPSKIEAELKIGYIDSQALMEQLPEFREAQQSLMQLKQDYENQRRCFCCFSHNISKCVLYFKCSPATPRNSREKTNNSNSNEKKRNPI